MSSSTEPVTTSEVDAASNIFGRNNEPNTRNYTDLPEPGPYGKHDHLSLRDQLDAHIKDIIDWWRN